MERFTLLTIAILLFASITKAQITKGSVFLGGSVTASNFKYESSNSTEEGRLKTLSISPQIGIAVKKNLIAGVELSYLKGSAEKYSQYSDFKRNGFGGGVFLRNYFPITNRLYFFGQSGLNYNGQKTEYPSTVNYPYSSKSKDQTFKLTFYPGLSVNIFKSFYFEAGFNDLLSLGYTKSTSTNAGNGSTSTQTQKGLFFQTSLLNNSSFNIGVRFIIPKK
jgi:hypothetical protein